MMHQTNAHDGLKYKMGKDPVTEDDFSIFNFPQLVTLNLCTEPLV